LAEPGGLLTSSTTTSKALAAACAILLSSVVGAKADDCRPKLDPSRAQYIVGYGSLMQSASKRMTEPRAGINLPVLVTGFQRAWNHRGTYPTTYLGVEPAKSARMAAALYRSFLEDGKLESDAREFSYCRAAVEPAAIQMLDGSTVPSPAEIWIYVDKPESLAPPAAHYPITQSYVDIFITGCMELQERVSEPDVDFVEQCVVTTRDWSKHWVNDRLQPRRPYIHEPRAFEIDGHLNRLLPTFVDSIRIE